MDARSFIFNMVGVAGIVLVIGVLIVGAVCLALGIGLGYMIHG